MSNDKSLINFRKIEDEYVNGLREEDEIYFPTVHELAVKYKVSVDVINDYFDSNPSILNERKLNITTNEKRKLFSTAEGVVEYINNLDNSFIDLGEDIINSLKVSFIDSIAEGRAKDAESWMRVMEKYYTIINDIKQDRKNDMLRKESENFENTNSAMSEKLLVMVERVLKDQIDDDSISNIIEMKDNNTTNYNKNRKKINAKKQNNK